MLLAVAVVRLERRPAELFELVCERTAAMLLYKVIMEALG